MPDLNSVPASPRPLASRRQSSKDMPPPAMSSDPSLNILPSNQTAVNPTTSSTPTGESPQISASQPHSAISTTRDTSSEAGPGPLRHPRPLTASELHIELEKEQEAVVNRLTRELSLLRAAQNASVVSNTSSTSATPSGQEHPNEPLLSGSGFTIPNSRRHRRTSSATSQQLGSSYDARRSLHAQAMSRQDSATSRRSRAGSPAPSSALDPSTYFLQQRMPPPPSSVPQALGSEQLSPGLMAGTARYEETQHFKNELEAAKRENEILKRKIRDLEKAVRERRSSQESVRPRSESVSTTASMSVAPSGGANIAGPRDSVASRTERDRGLTLQSTTSSSVAVGISEEEVQVGESAASSGLGNNSNISQREA